MPFIYKGRKVRKTGSDPVPQGLTVERMDLILTEAIGRDAALDVLARHRAEPVPGVRIYAGPRETGACALACARHLANWDVPCLAYRIGGEGRLEGEATRQDGILERLHVRRVDLLNEDHARGTFPTIDAGEVLVDGGREALRPGEEPGRAFAIYDAIAPALAERVPPAVAMAFDRKFRPPSPSAADAVPRIDAAPVTREQARLHDGTAIERYGIPGLALMENAGFYAARQAYLMLERPGEQTALIVCGKGNNGGDGFVIARYLAWWGVEVRCFLTGHKSQLIDDALVNFQMLDTAGVGVEELLAAEHDRDFAAAVESSGLIVDAVLGTGLSRPLRDDVLALVRMLNAAGRPVLAVDAPTGLDCNTGEALGDVVRADRTVSFGAPKQGFTQADGPDAAGEVIVADISLPRALWQTA